MIDRSDEPHDDESRGSFVALWEYLSVGKTSPTGDRKLLIGLMVYGAVNFLAVAMGPMRMIPTFAIFDILFFFVFIGPSIAIAGVSAAQFGCKQRPFTWSALVLFVVAMLFAAWVNLVIFAQASAAV